MIFTVMGFSLLLFFFWIQRWWIGFILFGIFNYIQLLIDTNSKENRNNQRMKDDYKENKGCRAVDRHLKYYQYRLHDYYIQSSYNSCCGGNFLNDFVSLEPLKILIAHGIRCLDFAVYYMTPTESNKAIAAVGAGKDNSVHWKGTLNHLDINTVFKTINNWAFSKDRCKNSSDPLFIHLRIISEKKEILDLITDAIENAFSGKLLTDDPIFQNEANDKSIVDHSLFSFMHKVIIIIENNDISDRILKHSRLYKYVSFSSESKFLKQLRNNELLHEEQESTIKKYNKTNMTLTMPDYSIKPYNIAWKEHHDRGCQMVCMNYQRGDPNDKESFLGSYRHFFNSGGQNSDNAEGTEGGRASSFILKAKELRAKRTFVPSGAGSSGVKLEMKCFDVPGGQKQLCV